MNITLIILVVYLLVMLLVAYYFSRRESLEAYFLNSKKTSLWLMTFSNVATLVGAGATVAIVSEVYNSGISYGLALPLSFISGVIILGLLAKKIKQIGEKYNAYTIVDFYNKRFDAKNKVLVGILQILLLLIWIAVQIIALASLAQVLVGINYTLAIILSAGITILYTTMGGLKIDIITDFIQFWIILIVFIIASIFGYLNIGGIQNLISSLPKEHLNPFAFGGVQWFIGVILLSGFIYLGNTSHWQRIFSAKDVKTAKNSFFYSIPFVAIISLIVLFFGLLSSVLLSGINQDIAFYALMNKILPPWLVGISFASVLAVVMSSVDSFVVGGSTIIFRTIFKKNHYGNKKDLLFARLITAGFGILGSLIAFIVPNIVALSLFVGYLILIFIPSIFSGLYSKKISPNASFYSILVPFILLASLFPIIGKNTFLITTILSVLIVLFYDKVFKSHQVTHQ